MHRIIRQLLAFVILTGFMAAFGGEGGGGTTILPKPSKARPPSAAASSLDAQL